MTGWVTRPLSDVAEVHYGTRVVRRKDGGSLYPVYGGGGATFSVDEHNREDCFIVSRFGMSAECVRFVSGRFFLNDSGLTVRTKSDQLLQEFLDRQLLAKQSVIYDLSRGTAQRNLDVPMFRELAISYPTCLDQQRQTVEVLDEAFAAIATTITNAEENLANARDLFASELDALVESARSKFPGRALADHCRRVTVGHVGPMKDRYQDDGIPFLRSQNVRPFQIELDGVAFIDEAFDAELAKSRLAPGDVAVVRTGYPGTAAVIPLSLPISNCADLVIIRPGADLNPHYVAAFLNSNLGKRMIAGNLVGAAQKHFNVGAAKKVAIPLPPLVEQERFVTRVDQLRGLSAQLTEVYEQKLGKLRTLKQASLHRAFYGDLTARASLAA